GAHRRRSEIIEAGDHGCVIAGADVAQHRAGARLLGDPRAREHIVEAPADVPLSHVAPRRPPREESVVIWSERPADVDQATPEQAREELALLRSLADEVRLALLRVHVAL